MKRPLIITVVLILLAAMAAYFFMASRTPRFPPVPNPNGYDDFVAAGNLLDTTTSDAHEMDHKALRAYIATNSEAIRLIQLGLSRTSAVPTIEFLTNFSGKGPDLHALRRVAQFWTATGRLAEFERRTNDAAIIYADGIRFAANSSRGGFLIHALVAFWCEAIGTASLVRVVTNLDCETSREIIRTLDEADRTAPHWDEILRYERIFIRRKLFRNPSPGVWIDYFCSHNDISKSHINHQTTTARRRLIIVELALRCYKAESGRVPTSLDELTPKYLSRIPTDPFTKAPFIYRAGETNWLLYSVGPDGVDDGGKPLTGWLTKSPPNPGDIFFDTR